MKIDDRSHDHGCCQMSWFKADSVRHRHWAPKCVGLATCYRLEPTLGICIESGIGYIPASGPCETTIGPKPSSLKVDARGVTHDHRYYDVDTSTVACQSDSDCGGIIAYARVEVTTEPDNI